VKLEWDQNVIISLSHTLPGYVHATLVTCYHAPNAALDDMPLAQLGAQQRAQLGAQQRAQLGAQLRSCIHMCHHITCIHMYHHITHNVNMQSHVQIQRTCSRALFLPDIQVEFSKTKHVYIHRQKECTELNPFHMHQTELSVQAKGEVTGKRKDQHTCRRAFSFQDSSTES
jgi:hypothetical protein